MPTPPIAENSVLLLLALSLQSLLMPCCNCVRFCAGKYQFFFSSMWLQSHYEGVLPQAYGQSKEILRFNQWKVKL